MRNLVMICAILWLGGCGVKSSNEIKNYKILQIKDENLTSDAFWYQRFNDPNLDALINLALKNNADLKKAGLNLKKSMINAGLIVADFAPTLSANSSFNASRDISKSDEFAKKYQNGLTLSYELDLFGKIRANNQSASWSVKYSEFDLENVKITLINSLVSAYFNALYLQNANKFYEQNLAITRDLERIVRTKFAFGKSEYADVLRIEQNVLETQKSLVNLQSQIATNDELLRNLLGVTPDFNLKFGKNLDEISHTHPDLNVPFYALGNRADIKAMIANLNAKFFDYKVAFADFFPSISLGAGLSDIDAKFSQSYGLNLFSQSVSIKLPFLDFARVKMRAQSADVDFLNALNSYQNALNVAKNEVYKSYALYQNSLENEQISKANLAKLSKLFEISVAQYKYGKTELKEYLSAQKDLINAQISVLNAKYETLKNEAQIYKAMGARFLN